MSGTVWVASYVMLWAAVVVLSLVCLALLRQIGVLHARLRPMGVHFAGEGPDIGSQAPPSGTDYTSHDLTLLAFTSPECSICRTLVPGLRALERDYREVAIEVVDHDPSTAGTFAAFNVRSTPYFVAVGRDGVVRARGVGNTLEQVEVLLEEAIVSDGRR